MREDISAQLISEEIFNKVTKRREGDATPRSRTYYHKNRRSTQQPQTRDVRHILVKTKALADSVYAQLKNGADFAALAKKYSQDTGSKAQGGKLTISQGPDGRRRSTRSRSS